MFAKGKKYGGRMVIFALRFLPVGGLFLYYEQSRCIYYERVW